MTDVSAAARLPRVAIVGRPNVGKSTLFNRIVGRRQAIVGRESGLTRDRHTAETDWTGTRFVLTDTGGLEWGTTEDLLQQVEQQVLAAVDSADLVLFVGDGRAGILPVESQTAVAIRRRGIPMLLVVNKCDTSKIADTAAADFHALGLGAIFTVSAEQGRGVGELLDALVAALPGPHDAQVSVPESTLAARVAVVGRPNVGKSSLVNALLGRTRVIVSDLPGTTRDAIDTVLELQGRRYLLVDTAGIRKRAKVATHAELASVAVARRRLQRADVALLLIDPHDGLTRQDLHLASEAGLVGCGLIVVVNKWDTTEKEEGLTVRFRERLRQRLGRLSYARVAFTSATEGDGVEALLPLVDAVSAARSRRIGTAELNAAFEAMLRRYQPGGGTAGVWPKYLTQVGVNPPTFVVFAAGRGSWRTDYRRYLENRLREAFDFSGTPMIIRVRRSSHRRSY
ncbi:MAG: ribosome biogenesis GTPase Der [Acidobacteriota bacterium]